MKPARRSMVIGMRRSLLALGISLAVHFAAVAAVVGVSAWRLLSMAPKIQVQTIAVDLIKDLPLGAPPAKAVEKVPESPAPVRKPRHRAKVGHEGVVVPAAPDAAAPELAADAAVGKKREAIDGGSSDHDGGDVGGGIDGGRRRPGDLRSNGPEGSRVVALLYLDRLRASRESEKTIVALDQLLLLLPDRRRLIEGTGFDLYRDFDSLLIATPNPTDADVTFLAARHHLGDVALKAGLDRASKAARKPIRWQNRDGRPVGVRKSMDSSALGLDRDDRILVLPQTNLAIMAPAAYAAVLLGVDPSASPGKTPPPLDGGAIDGGSPGPHKTARIPWRDIVARIDAEDAAVPEDAVFMMSATHVFGSSVPSPRVVIPPTRGAPDDTPVQPVPGASPVPEVVTLVVGAPVPYIHVIAEFKTEEDAQKWEQDLPAWRRKALLNPVVLVSGFSPLIRRVEISRDGSNLELQVDATSEEIQRILNLAANLTRSALTKPR
jgi:hypothetical protein